MSDFQEKVPEPPSQMVRRPETVDGLFNETILGGKSDAAHSVASKLDGGKGLNWDSIFAKTDKELQNQESSGTDKQTKAQAEIMRQELKDLNTMSSSDRNSMLSSYQVNDQQLDKMKQATDGVHNALFSAQLPSALEQQNKVVDLADGLSQKALQSEVGSINKVLQKESDPEVKNALDKQLNAALDAMASPFVERARLGAIQQRAHQDFQAEHSFDDAIKASRETVPAEAWQLSSSQNLRQNVADALSDLQVQHHLLEMWDSNVAKFSKITGRDDVRKNDLSSLTTSDSKFAALSKFLSNNYDDLTKKHPMWARNQGITREDIQHFVKDHDKSINDLDVRPL